MLHFCTLFDKNYMSRGLAMYQSLHEQCSSFHLYVFAFDDLCADVLQQMALPSMTVITLNEFEDEALLKIKPTRSRGEYCWTCTSSTILYCLKQYKLENCTYLDADLFFYRDPKELIAELAAQKHVIITEHRYTAYYDQSKVSGKYCVQFMYFDNSDASLEVLTWWRDRCLEWCYNRIEEGKFGDQKYLDDWTERFSCVHELQNLGGGLAPWNIQQYRFKEEHEELHGSEIATGKGFYPVFYHFHGIKFYDHGGMVFAPNTYHISKEILLQFYHPYIYRLNQCRDEIQRVVAGLDPHGTLPKQQFFKDKYVKGKWAYIKANYIKRLKA
jgi:hypothetical protein